MDLNDIVGQKIRMLTVVKFSHVETVEQRITQRGGTVTPTISRRVDRMRSLGKKADFVGTSSEVLEFLTRLIADEDKDHV